MVDGDVQWDLRHVFAIVMQPCNSPCQSKECGVLNMCDEKLSEFLRSEERLRSLCIRDST